MNSGTSAGGRRFSSGRTPRFSGLRRLVKLALQANRPGAPPADELVERERARALSRRESLRALGAVLVARRPPPPAPPPPPVRTGPHVPRIAVVGAGLAGLRATDVLSRAGYRATLYSADARVGGRVVSASGLLAPGVTTEFGGEFIDSSHADMLALAREFGLALHDLSTDHLAEAYYFQGQHLTEAQVVSAFRPLAFRIAADLKNVPDDISFVKKTPEAVRLDRMSMAEYLHRAGVGGWLYDLLRASYINEDGQEIEAQSSLNFVTQIGTDLSQGFQVIGDSDERYKVKGGNQQIITGLAARVAGQIELGQYLVAVRSRGQGFVLTFAVAHGPTYDVFADVVILALPFSILRQVALAVPLPPIKRRVIDELGYGTNTKLLLGTSGRPWRAQGYNGDVTTDAPFQAGFDHGEAEPTPAGGFTLYLGGAAGVAAGAGTADQQVRRFLPSLDRVFPGAAAAFNGRTARADWPGNPFVHGSYSNYLTGQYVGLGGAQAFPVGNLFFAGEHCNHPELGYMDGAARTGRLAAEGVLRLVRR